MEGSNPEGIDAALVCDIDIQCCVLEQENKYVAVSESWCKQERTSTITCHSPVHVDFFVCTKGNELLQVALFHGMEDGHLILCDVIMVSLLVLRLDW